MNTARMSWWSPVVPKSHPAPGHAESHSGRSEEAALLRSLAEGSQEAFSAIYREHGQRVFRAAYRRTASRELAEEIAQETFLLLLREPGKFDPARGELGAFLAGVARQISRRMLAQAGRTSSIDTEEEQVSGETALGVLHEIIERQQWELLHEAVASLPDPYREIVVMHHLEELPYEDIAEALACPLGTVRSRLTRGRELLARKLVGRRADGLGLERPVTGDASDPQPGKGGTQYGTEG
ncbi:MAG: RNA polymerase sigma factor [Bryobacterales bacterium]|nr:RNA polymerase sigma factor [Bryobacterales bacterium]